jgi:hypothetical protein
MIIVPGTTETCIKTTAREVAGGTGLQGERNFAAPVRVWRLALDKREGVVKRHFFAALL